MPAPPVVALILSGVIAVPGAIVVRHASASFGWFAYRLLFDSVCIPDGFIVLTHTVIIGGDLAVLGLIGLSGVVEFAYGRRRGLVE
jgi:hypothetical protein